MTTAQHDDSPETDALDKVVRIGQLMDLYGGLLTDRQRMYVQMHYEEDLSFGEIAKGQGVSRQAIHDAVKHGEAALEEYESKLCLLERGYTRTAAGAEAAPSDEAQSAGESATPSAVPASTPGPEVGKVAERLGALHQRLLKTGGIIYNGDAVAREVGECAAELNRLIQSS